MASVSSIELPAQSELHERINTSDKVDIFPEEKENDTEVIAGFNVKHLNFRASVMSQGGRVFLPTRVHSHNAEGWLNLKVIMLFHILIVRHALCRVEPGSSVSMALQAC